MTQLFYAHYIHGNLVLVVATIVDDMLLTGISDQVETFVKTFNDRIKGVYVAPGPGKLGCYDLNIVQDNE